MKSIQFLTIDRPRKWNDFFISLFTLPNEKTIFYFFALTFFVSVFLWKKQKVLSNLFRKEVKLKNEKNYDNCIKHGYQYGNDYSRFSG